jgi:hypothetical protein
MYPHRIRLRAPWERKTSVDGSGMSFLRRFGIPRRLDDYERVWLTFSGMQAPAEVWLNEQLLHNEERTAEPFEVEVTSLLRERNEARVELHQPDAEVADLGNVALEIRCRAFLRNVQIKVHENRLRISGEVVGDWSEPLELYAVAGRSVVGYEQVTATPAGRAFELETQELSSLGAELRIELVNGGTIWYALTDLYFA